MSNETQDAMSAADDPRRLRRAEKAARKAQKAQEKADRARREALDAVRASGFDVNEADVDEPTADEVDVNDIEPENGESGSGSSVDGKAGDRTRSEGTTGETATGSAAGAAAAAAAKTSTMGSGGDAAESEDEAEAGAGQKRRPTSSEKNKQARSATRPAPKLEGNPKLASALLALAAVLAIVAVVSWVGYGTQRDAVANEQAETNAPYEAADAARAIVTDMFTYEAATVDEQLGKVEPLLTGEAEQEFRETTRPQVASLAKETEANSYATVAAVGLEERIDQDHVVTVMMLNRMVSTKDNPEAQNSSTRLRVSVDRVDDGGDMWKVSKVEVL